MDYGLEDNQIDLTSKSLGVKHMFLFTRRKNKLDSHSHECISLGYDSLNLRLIILCTPMIEKNDI
jgi:hypothetical protein